MANITATDFEITLGGKQYTLTFPLPALWLFEDEAKAEIFSDPEEGASEQEVQKAFDERIFGKTKRSRMERTSLLLWAGLQTKHPEITKEQAAAMVYPHNMVYVKNRVLEAFAAAISGPQEESTRPLEAATEASV